MRASADQIDWQVRNYSAISVRPGLHVCKSARIMMAMLKPTDPIADARLDLWLWAARFFKTRSLAKAAIVGGKVRVNDLPCKPAKTLHPGDRVQVDRAGERWLVEVIGLSELRGSAETAAGLYREDDAHRQARLQLREQRRFEALGMQAPPSKPDKKARRLLRALGDFDAS